MPKREKTVKNLRRPPRRPDTTQHLAIFGHNGSGKTVAALDHIAESAIDEIPYILYDFKRDEHIAAIPYAKEIPLDYLPREPGIYVIRPRRDTDDEAVERHMGRIYDRGYTGVYIDEGYMLQRSNRSFQYLQTQGRSKHIPIITVTQRPKMLPTPFIISEAAFFRLYDLTDNRDIDRVAEFIKYNVDPENLPKYHSYYYDVGRKQLDILGPARTPEQIMEIFDIRLRPPETRAESTPGNKFIFL